MIKVFIVSYTYIQSESARCTRAVIPVTSQPQSVVFPLPPDHPTQGRQSICILDIGTPQLVEYT